MTERVRSACGSFRPEPRCQQQAIEDSRHIGYGTGAFALFIRRIYVQSTFTGDVPASTGRQATAGIQQSRTSRDCACCAIAPLFHSRNEEGNRNGTHLGSEALSRNHASADGHRYGLRSVRLALLDGFSVLVPLGPLPRLVVCDLLLLSALQFLAIGPSLRRPFWGCDDSVGFLD